MNALRVSLFLVPIVLMAPGTGGAESFESALNATSEGRYGEAAAVFHALARQGDAEAAFNLALLFATGRGIPQNDTEASYWAWRARLADVRAADALLERIWPPADGARRKTVANRLEADLMPLAVSGDGAAMLQLAAVLTVLREKPDRMGAHAWQSIAAALDVPGAALARDTTLSALPAPERMRAQDQAFSAFRDWCAALKDDRPAACIVVSAETEDVNASG